MTSINNLLIYCSWICQEHTAGKILIHLHLHLCGCMQKHSRRDACDTHFQFTPHKYAQHTCKHMHTHMWTAVTAHNYVYVCNRTWCVIKVDCSFAKLYKDTVNNHGDTVNDKSIYKHINRSLWHIFHTLLAFARALYTDFVVLTNFVLFL